MVKNLTGIVSNTSLAFGSHLFECSVGKLGVGNQIIQIVDIGLQMIAIVETNGLLANYRSQSLSPVAERWQQVSTTSINIFYQVCILFKLLYDRI